jgi:hypothetical protein
MSGWACQGLVRRAKLVRFALSFLVVGLAGIAFGSASASAYVRIDSKCILRVTTPYYISSNGSFLSDGAVDCTGYGALHLQIQVCPQVFNPDVSPYWFTKNNDCVYSGTVYTDYAEDYKYVTDWAAGHQYRAWDWGEDNSTGATNTYSSSSFTCGCG